MKTTRKAPRLHTVGTLVHSVVAVNIRSNPGRAGRWRFLHEHYGKRTYWARHIGHVGVMRIEPRTPNNPSDRPWQLVCWGTTHETPEAALDYAIASYHNPPESRDDRSYERAEALMCGPGRFEEP